MKAEDRLLDKKWLSEMESFKCMLSHFARCWRGEVSSTPQVAKKKMMGKDTMDVRGHSCIWWDGGQGHFKGSSRAQLPGELKGATPTPTRAKGRYGEE